MVQPEYLLGFVNYHITPGLVCHHDGSGNPFPCSTGADLENLADHFEAQDALLRINHYSFRDEWFYENVKKPRSKFFGRNTDFEYQNNVLYYNKKEDKRILEVLNNLQRK